MKKISIKTRIFMSFTIFTIFIVNIFSIFLFLQTKNNFILETKKYILNEFETIKTFIDLQENSIFILPKIEIEKINSLGFYFYIGNNDKELQEKYKIGFYENKESIIFRGDYNNYNIILGKKLFELNNIEKNFYEKLIYLNIFLIIFSFFVSYFITFFSLKPLYKLIYFLDKYDKNKKQKLLKNNFGKTEIGILINSINNFIKQNNKILEKQRDFIQDTSHELKTPLMQINSNIELLENKITDNKIKEKLNQIKKSADNINLILSNLNFILRGEKLELKKEKINLKDYFYKLIKKFETKANKKNIKILIDIKDNISIEGNIYYFDMIFGNLLNNAIYYNNGGGFIRILITTNFIEIIDEGIGIEKEELSKIFDRFYRNKNSNLYSQNGNGLGLSIVKKVCNLFGWIIKVESQKGRGTKFKVILTKV